MPGQMIDFVARPGSINVNVERKAPYNFHNYRFTAKEGGTQRASVLSRLGRYFSPSRLLVKLQGFCRCLVDPKIRAQSSVVREQRANSGRIVNLLSNLTVPVNDGNGRSRIAKSLVELSKQMRHCCAEIPGAQHGLNHCLGTLKEADLLALTEGVLFDAQARDTVCRDKQLDYLHESAKALLRDVAVAVVNELLKRIEDPQLPHSEYEAIKERLGNIVDKGMKEQTSPVSSLPPHKSLAISGDMDNFHKERSLHFLNLYNGGRNYFSHMDQDRIDPLPADWTDDDEDDESILGLPLDGDGKAIATKTNSPPDNVAARKMGGGMEVARDNVLMELSTELCDKVRAALVRADENRAGLMRLGQKVYDAVGAGNPQAAAKALYHLSAAVRDVQSMHRQLSAEMDDHVRAVISGTKIFHDSESNKDAPLDYASLNKLDDASFGYLRKAQSLHSMGLELDSEAVKQIISQRTPSQRSVEGMKNVVRTLVQDKVDMAELMRRVRDLCEVESKRERQLQVLGAFSLFSVDNRIKRIKEICKAALDALAEEGENPKTLFRALRHTELLEVLGGKYVEIGQAVDEIKMQQGCESSANMIVKSLEEASQLLFGMAEALPEWRQDRIDERLRALLDQPEDSFEPIKPSQSRMPSLSPAGYVPDEAFYRELKGQYEVSYDPKTEKAAVLVTDSVRAKFVSALENLPPPNADRTTVIPLPVRGVDETFSVNEQFVTDGIVRPSVSLSVRGAAADGQPIHYAWPDQVPDGKRRDVMGHALHALVRVAGAAAAEPLTRLMNQRVGSAWLKGLNDMGEGSPFKLDDGRSIGVVGAGGVAFDLAKNEDGSFRIEAAVKFDNLKNGLVMKPDGDSEPVGMKSESSWAETRFTWNVSPDGQQIKMVELPAFRYHLDVESVGD